MLMRDAPDSLERLSADATLRAPPLLIASGRVLRPHDASRRLPIVHRRCALTGAATSSHGQLSPLAGLCALLHFHAYPLMPRAIYHRALMDAGDAYR